MTDSQMPPGRGQRPNQPPQQPRIAQRPPAERIPGGAGQGGYPPRQPGQGDPTRTYQAPPTQSAKRAPAPEPASSGLVVPWWGFVLVILAVGGITCGLWGLVLMNRGDVNAGLNISPTPIFVVITATPTLGPPPGEIQQTLGPTPTTPPSVIEPTIEGPSATPPPAPIALGSTVQVFGTEGLGVKIRQGPGTTYSSFLLAQDGDVFVVQEGPREADGYTWWHVIDPDDSSRDGWVVQDFIEVVSP